MKKLAIFVLAAAVIGLSAVEPHVDLKEIKLKDGRTTYDRMVYFNDGHLILKHTTADGVKTVSKKWGEIFFGFRFGQLPRTNGGWSIWDFFRCYEYNGKVSNLVRDFVPRQVTANSINGIAVIDMEYPSLKGGTLKIRMMQFPSHPTWVFMRVTAKDFKIWRLDFQAYPYQSDMPKDRERHLRTEKGDFNINKEKVSYTPQGSYLALYNKFVQDTASNFLIIQPEKIKTVEVPKCGAGVDIRLYANKDVQQFDFAVGYQNNHPASDAVNRFFGENGDAIRKFMEGIDWNPRLSTANFDKSYAEAQKLGVSADKLASVKKSYEEAMKKGDTTAAANAEKELDKLKKEKAASGLNDFM